MKRERTILGMAFGAALLLLGAATIQHAAAQDLQPIFDELDKLKADNEALRKKVVDLEERLDDLPEHAAADAALPKGTVLMVADEEGCPEAGWDEYVAARGKFIIGVGHGVLTPKGDHGHPAMPAKLQPLAFEDQGGEERVTLTESQAAEHAHNTYFGLGPADGAPRKLLTALPPLTEEFHATTASEEGIQLWFGAYQHPEEPTTELPITPTRTLETPPAQAHNNMPPFIALYFCVKEGR